MKEYVKLVEECNEEEKYADEFTESIDITEGFADWAKKNISKLKSAFKDVKDKKLKAKRIDMLAKKFDVSPETVKTTISTLDKAKVDSKDDDRVGHSLERDKLMKKIENEFLRQYDNSGQARTQLKKALDGVNTNDLGALKKIWKKSHDWNNTEIGDRKTSH
jgi:predicted transcriptional regulator